MVAQKQGDSHAPRRIRLDPSTDQRDYFARAAGTARRVWNWALAEWLRRRDAGGKPNAHALKHQFNAMQYSDPDWLDASGQPWLKTRYRAYFGWNLWYYGGSAFRVLQLVYPATSGAWPNGPGASDCFNSWQAMLDGPAPSADPGNRSRKVKGKDDLANLRRQSKKIAGRGSGI